MRFSLFLMLIFFSCTYNEVVLDCVPSEQDYIALVKPIIEENCINCHNDNSGRPAILTSYIGVIDAIDNQSLKNWVVDLQMPPGNPLEQSDIDVLIKWIDCE